MAFVLTELPEQGDLYPMETERRRWRWSLLMASIPLVGFVMLGLRYLGFVRDDWNHYVNMRDLHEQGSIGQAMWLLATNDWFGAHELRIFFGSFMTHYFVSETGALAPIAIYAIQLAMHVSSAALVGYLIWRFTGSQLGTLAAALLLTFAPTISQAPLWINNLFFVQPWFLLCLTATLMSIRRLRSGWKVTAITATAFMCQFSGEATIPLLYGLLLFFAFHGVLHSLRFRDRIGAVLPLLIATVSLVVYLQFIVTRPAAGPINVPAWDTVRAYMEGFRDQFQALNDVTSAQYGSGSVPISPVAMVAAGTLAACALIALSIVPAHSLGGIRALARATLVIMIALPLACLPMLFGVVTGARPGPDLRYQYVPSQVAYALFILVLLLAGARLGHGAARVLKLTFGVVVTYTLFVTVFNIADIWGLQRAIDSRIWAQVEKSLSATTTSVVTYNPNHPYLMAPYHSNAVSDFQADWGVAGRIAWEHPDWSRVNVYRDAQLLDDGDIALRGYYGDVTSCEREESNIAAGWDSTLYMTFDYGPSMGDLASSPLVVTSDILEYEASRDSLRNRTPEASPWPVASAMAACVGP